MTDDISKAINELVSKRVARANRTLVDEIVPIMKEYVAQELGPLKARLDDLEDNLGFDEEAFGEGLRTYLAKDEPSADA